MMNNKNWVTSSGDGPVELATYPHFIGFLEDHIQYPVLDPAITLHFTGFLEDHKKYLFLGWPRCCEASSLSEKQHSWHWKNSKALRKRSFRQLRFISGWHKQSSKSYTSFFSGLRNFAGNVNSVPIFLGIVIGGLPRMVGVSMGITPVIACRQK